MIRFHRTQELIASRIIFYFLSPTTHFSHPLILSHLIHPTPHPAWLLFNSCSVVVKALFKGKVRALFDLFRRGQAISLFRLLLLPIILWVELNAGELDDGLVESCRALRCVRS